MQRYFTYFNNSIQIILQIWRDAASQVFFTLGVGVGGVIALASYNKFRHNFLMCEYTRHM